MRAHTVVAVSRHTCKFCPARAEVIGNGIRTEQYQGEPIKSSKQSILFVGETKSRKRGDLLQSIFSREIKDQIRDAELWMVSPDVVEGDGVRWFRNIDDVELANLYRAAWVFCLPSSYEGFG